jgi:hypothetical protein
VYRGSGRAWRRGDLRDECESGVSLFLPVLPLWVHEDLSGCRRYVKRNGGGVYQCVQRQQRSTVLGRIEQHTYTVRYRTGRVRCIGMRAATCILVVEKVAWSVTQISLSSGLFVDKNDKCPVLV